MLIIKNNREKENEYEASFTGRIQGYAGKGLGVGRKRSYSARLTTKDRAYSTLPTDL